MAVSNLTIVLSLSNYERARIVHVPHSHTARGLQTDGILGSVVHTALPLAAEDWIGKSRQEVLD